MPFLGVVARKIGVRPSILVGRKFNFIK